MNEKAHDASILNDAGSGAAADWRSRDLAVLWHPCTQMREHPDTLPLLPIARGDGARLVGHAGRRTPDAVSGWWTNPFGDAAPRTAGARARPARAEGRRGGEEGVRKWRSRRAAGQ